jgi:DNA polymerase III subunit gamma/tau
MAKQKSEPESHPAPEKTQEYTVVARRYRPQQFNQLIGQESTAQALMNALTGDRVAHAYLFTGARGVGKTSCARILAKALNCEKGPTPTPCDECEICNGIISGDDVDVLEIDGASNNKVDEIRELRNNVGFRPSRARYKIYVIDEVHMLSTSAFNALLKTLEEPPPHVKFIFATTEVNKIPITILSRCQRFDFGLIRPEAIAEHLRTIVSQENLQADDAAIDLIARRASGSMRDAESLLDQLLAFGEQVTPALVHKLLGTAPAERVAGIAKAIFDHDAKSGIDLFNASLREGSQVGELLDQLVEFWRDLMLLASCGANASGLANPLDTLQALATATTLDALLAGLDVLATTKSRMKFTSYGSLLVEMAIVRLSRMDQLFAVGDLWAMVQSGSGVAPVEGQRTQAKIAPPHGPDEKKKLMTSQAVTSL